MLGKDALLSVEQATILRDALRSNRYKRGRTYLRSLDNRFCAIGVLCNELGMEWLRGEEAYELVEPLTDGNRHTCMCVPATIPYSIKIGENIVSIICLNDKRTASFEMLAAVLDEYIAENRTPVAA